MASGIIIDFSGVVVVGCGAFLVYVSVVVVIPVCLPWVPGNVVFSTDCVCDVMSMTVWVVVIAVSLLKVTPGDDDILSTVAR